MVSKSPISISLPGRWPETMNENTSFDCVACHRSLATVGASVEKLSFSAHSAEKQSEYHAFNYRIVSEMCNGAFQTTRRLGRSSLGRRQPATFRRRIAGLRAGNLRRRCCRSWANWPRLRGGWLDQWLPEEMQVECRRFTPRGDGSLAAETPAVPARRSRRGRRQRRGRQDAGSFAP